MPTPDGRQFCLVFLNSVGDGLRWLLPMCDEFARQYSVLTHVSYEAGVNYQLLSSDHINQCDLLICHPAETAPFADRDAYRRFLAGFPQATQKILVPAPHFAAFWPFLRARRNSLPLPMYQPFWPGYVADPAIDEPDWPADVRGDLPDYPFGDDYILARWREGVAADALVAEYVELDVATVADLDALLARSLTALAEADAASGVQLADFVATMFRREKLFVAPELAGNPLLRYIASEVLKLLGLPALPHRLLDRLQPLIKIEAPIHPSIGRFLDAPYIGDDTRYVVDRHRSLTCAEYIAGYVGSLVRQRRREEAALQREPTASLAGN